MNKQRPQFYCYFLFLTFLFFVQNHLVAQTITQSYNISKLKILQYEYNGQQIKELIFDGSMTSHEFSKLPALVDKVEVNQLYTSYKYTLSNAKYEFLTPEESALIPTEYNFPEPRVDIQTATDARKHYAMLNITPFIKSANGQYQRLVSCDIRFEGSDPVQPVKRGGLVNSVLSTGTWYKIAVNSTGLYKVTYNDLKNLGISMSGLQSSSIALFGNGGGMISDINPLLQVDDLMETPIKVFDNGNGVFDENSYFVFYAQGPHIWKYNANTGVFSHSYNIYSDNAYYFINVDLGNGEKKRIETKSFMGQTATHEATSFTYCDFYEKDQYNFEESGRYWFDEAIAASGSKTYNFSMPEPYDTHSGRIKIGVAATASGSAKMELSWGNDTKEFSLSTGSSPRISVFEVKDLSFSTGNLALRLKLNTSQTSAVMRLDYIEIQAKCKLKVTGSVMPFAITENIGASNISLINLNNASSYTVWDVTEHNAVYAVAGTLSGSQFSFHLPSDQPRRLIAFDGTTYNSITTVGKVETQNLHSFAGVDMVIVSHPKFLSEANRLAQFRATQNNITVKVVTPEQVYNEFSSGAQDPVAIRNFMRYLYDLDTQTIKYLLLFGRPSYDYRGRIAGTQLFVPNFQEAPSGYSLLSLSAGGCDNFFGVLNFNEGDMSSDLVNIAVGRFPVSTLAQAKIAVDKTINASVRYKIDSQNASQVSNFGDWRNSLTVVTDDYDGVDYAKSYGEEYTKGFTADYPSFNLDKIYSDAYPLVSNAGGQRYPDVTKAINMRMEKGTLAMFYFGHGGGNGWSHERILEIVDINNWKNKYNQPLMVTLTCSFGWYDKPATSPAELVFLNENGGAASLITTSREIGIPAPYARQLFKELGSKMENRYKTIGEINRLAIGSGQGDNLNSIYLMGDPAMMINVPNQHVKTDAILGEEMLNVDTVKAFTKVTVKGSITDDSGEVLTNFNGNIYPSVYDKIVKQRTLGQKGSIWEFDVQKNIIFKGNATVKNGIFEFSFIVPRDINSGYGNGKISYYATSDNDDAGGYFDNFILGGMSNKPLADDKGPDIRIFLNDDKFVPGGITNPNPILFLKLKDESGINTSGNGIGHDLVAILDNNIEKQMILNDYYLADQDSYNSGTVRFPLQNLEPGKHTITVRAWDIANNHAEESIEFVVKSDSKLLIEHVLNYPNPFTTNTSFYFEHNQPTETFDILIHIFTVSGKLVKTLRDHRFLEGNNNHRYPIVWDGRDEYGDKIGKGVYLYRLTVRNSQGETVEKIEKIAIL